NPEFVCGEVLDADPVLDRTKIGLDHPLPREAKAWICRLVNESDILFVSAARFAINLPLNRRAFARDLNRLDQRLGGRVLPLRLAGNLQAHEVRRARSSFEDELSVGRL